MLERTLRYVAIVLSLFVATGFVLFALQDSRRASNETQQEIADYTAISPSAAAEQVRASHNGAVHERIDDVNDVLLKPFVGISEHAHSRWVQHGVPTLLALLVYGFGLGFLARFTKARHPTRPRAAHAA
ncbi:MAG TPA: hypothetical protein VHZ75_01490 [Solirubrobacteraceae bacterium]|nr:hypothetical protein [Solirubrobacteraceae bacterium]